MITEPEASGVTSRAGNIVVGALLVAFGVLWLLDVTDVVSVSVRVTLSVALVVVGAVLVWGSRWARHGGLIALGIVLTTSLVFATAVEAFAHGVGGGIGERVIDADDVDGRRLGIGSLTIDLRGGELAGDVEASVGIGELVVIVDDAAAVSVHARAGIGEVVVFDRQSGGFGPEVRIDVEAPEYRLVLSVGIGKVEVRE